MCTVVLRILLRRGADEADTLLGMRSVTGNNEVTASMKTECVLRRLAPDCSSGLTLRRYHLMQD